MSRQACLFGGALFAAGLVSGGAQAGGDRVGIDRSQIFFDAFPIPAGRLRNYDEAFGGPAGVVSSTGNGATFYSESSVERSLIRNIVDPSNPDWDSSGVFVLTEFFMLETVETVITWDFGAWQNGDVSLYDWTTFEVVVDEDESTMASGSVPVTLVPGRLYQFFATISGPSGGGDGFALLPYGGSPLFTQQPQSQVVEAGGAATLSVAVLGGGGHDAQWRRDGVALVDGDGVSGATTLELTIDPVSSADAGVYDCVLNGFASEGAALGVRPCLAGDANGDGAVDFSDLNAVLAQFGAGCGDAP